jgi:GT2 family glycosyltransferase/glycosyltransferase involved in cell wall biosynthesis
VNFRSADDTLAAIDGVSTLDWPSEQLEVIVVDNDSRDGSADRIAAAARGATVVRSATNLGFAGGCNLGVARSTGELVAFLNNDARPHPAWLARASTVLADDPTIGCVASKVLDWDGDRIDFAGAAMGFDGQGYKLHVGAHDGPGFDEADDVLFASGAAMVMPRAVFEELGGFDERYFMFFEDVDLGWRTWLRGWRVRYVPDSVVYHRHHATMHRYGPWFEQYLLDRNALFTIFKNYADASLARVFPAALLLTARRGAVRGSFDSRTLDLAHEPIRDDVPDMQVSKSTIASLAAVDSFVEQLPSLAASRAEIQRTRVRSDRSVARLFRLPLQANLPDEAYVEAYERIVTQFGVTELLDRRRRIVVSTSDALTKRMAGPAIRSWEMAKALSKEHTVRLVTKSVCEVEHPRFECRGDIDIDDWKALEDWCDVLIFQGFLLHDVPSLIHSDKVIVADLYDPFHLEQLELFRDEPLGWRSNVIADSVRVINEQLLRGDFFMCASAKQRDFWLGQLSAMQRVNPYVYEADEGLHHLLEVVPFGVPDEPPERTGPGLRGVVPGIGLDDKVIIWGGGIYNWFDPLTLISAIDRLRARIPEIRLFFMGTKHPNPDVPEMRVLREAHQLATDLGIVDTHVFFNDGWVPHEDRQNYLLDADIGVTTHLDHIETEFSFRTRVLDYFWTSLPVVTTAGDPLAALVEARGLGLTVPAEDVDALEEALHRMLTDDEFVAECCKNVDEVADEFRWSRVLEPLIEFCRGASRAPDAFVHKSPLRERSVGGLAAIFRGLPRSDLVDRVLAKLRRALAVHREGGPVLVARRSASWGRRKLTEPRS